MEWSGVEWSGVEWSGVERGGVGTLYSGSMSSSISLPVRVRTLELRLLGGGK